MIDFKVRSRARINERYERFNFLHLIWNTEEEYTVENFPLRKPGTKKFRSSKLTGAWRFLIRLECLRRPTNSYQGDTSFGDIACIKKYQALPGTNVIMQKIAKVSHKFAIVRIQLPKRYVKWFGFICE